MRFPFDKDGALKILSEKRRLMGRGLSYAEKILFLHQAENEKNKRPVPGKDQLRLYPDRVYMQDATAQMAMLQFILTGRDNTAVPATIHCDHLVRAADGLEADLRAALTANREVYDFLASAAKRYGIGFWKPGSGIMHQVIYENYAIPGNLMIGTDSHTPNAGGLGAVAIGVGGADAAEVMAGLPWEISSPYLVGVRLFGRLTGWASAKDVIFEMLRRFGVKGGTGKIFEYFGPGAASLSATQKATITNMGAEMGATTSVFVYDEPMDAYLTNAGRERDAAQAAVFSDILSQDPECRDRPEKVFDEVVEIDLGKIEPAHAGPYSPDALTRVNEFRSVSASADLPETVSAILLGSCTNSSYADLYAAAQVLSQAAEHGIRPKVPVMLSPGSKRIYETIKRDGLLTRFVQAGVKVLTATCGPCIGQWDRKDTEIGVPNCIFTTFNRNFRGRNDANPETRAFLTSPPLAAAVSLSGDCGFDPQKDTLPDSAGKPFKLSPPDAPALPKDGLAEVTGTSMLPDGPDRRARLDVDPHSERIQLLAPFDPWDGKDFIDLPVLIKTKGKTTTDHISPGGKWLRFRGHLENISKNLLTGAVNAFTGKTGRATNVFTGEQDVALFRLAAYYKNNAGGFVIVGDENYGEGSSREHAAMSPRYLGAKAVIAGSFARIHETNLKKQGLLPLTFSRPSDYNTIGEYDRISILGLAKLKSGKPVKAIVKKKDGSSHELSLNHTFTPEQVEWFNAGSSLNTV